MTPAVFAESSLWVIFARGLGPRFVGLGARMFEVSGARTRCAWVVGTTTALGFDLTFAPTPFSVSTGALGWDILEGLAGLGVMCLAAEAVVVPFWLKVAAVFLRAGTGVVWLLGRLLGEDGLALAEALVEP